MIIPNRITTTELDHDLKPASLATSGIQLHHFNKIDKVVSSANRHRVNVHEETGLPKRVSDSRIIYISLSFPIFFFFSFFSLSLPFLNDQTTGGGLGVGEKEDRNEKLSCIVVG